MRVMQFLYAQYISGTDSDIVECNMLHSIDKIYDLYVYLLNLLLAIRDKASQRIEVAKERRFKVPNGSVSDRKLVNNAFLEILSKNIYLSDYSQKNRQLTWKEQEGYISLLFEELRRWSYYESYMFREETSFESDKDFILKYYRTQIKSHQKLSECLEDQYVTWVDDLEIAHEMVYNTLKVIKPATSAHFRLYTLYKDTEDKDFIIALYRKTLFHYEFFDELIGNTASNWDLKRMAVLDRIILQMALCEFLYLPTIPPKVTMNEYIEITKVYSTEKSKVFVNGMLDQLLKILYDGKKIIKIGKGLM